MAPKTFVILRTILSSILSNGNRNDPMQFQKAFPSSKIYRVTSSLIMIQQYEIANIPGRVMKPLMFMHKLNSCWLILAVAINPFLYALHGKNIRQGVIMSMKVSTRNNILLKIVSFIEEPYFCNDNSGYFKSNTVFTALFKNWP